MIEPRIARNRRSIGVVGAVAVALAGLLSACSSTTVGQGTTVTRTVAPPSSTATGAGGGSSSPSTSPTPTGPPPKPVHVSLGLSDGSQVGVGMPIIAYLSRPIADAHAFAAATKVTVNGQPVQGAWYFERKYQDPGHPIEADYRTEHYWPGHARIHVDLPVKGKSAGGNLVFDDSLTLDFTTGRANILTVDDSTHKLTVTSDGKKWGTFPVSLGASATPTKRGIKVIMEKGRSICMSGNPPNGPSYHECGIKYTQRLTYDGEYLHAAPWNTYNIAHGIDSSNGCTNLYTEDAHKLYDFLEIGDVVQYPNASGPLMQMGDGYGDWNVPWAQWTAGGLYRTN